MEETHFLKYILHPRAQIKPAQGKLKKYLQLPFSEETSLDLLKVTTEAHWQSCMWKSSFPALPAAAWTREALSLSVPLLYPHNYNNWGVKYYCNMFRFIIEGKYNRPCCWKCLFVCVALRGLENFVVGGGRHPGMSSVPFGFLQPQKELCAWAVMQNIWWAWLWPNLSLWFFFFQWIFFLV